MRTIFSFIVILLLSTILNASFFGPIDEPLENQPPTELLDKDHWKLHVYIGYLDNKPIPELEFNTLQTDTSSQQLCPVMFNIPDEDGNIIDIHEYLDLYGDLPYEEFLPLAIKKYYESMFRGFIIDVIIETDPTKPGSKYWELDSYETYGSFDGTIEELKWQIRDKYTEHYGDLNEYEQYSNWSGKENMLLLVPKQDSYLYDGYTNYTSDYIYGVFHPDALNFTTEVIAHEIAHNIFNFADKGFDTGKYGGYLDGESMGMTFSTTGAYDMMYHKGFYPSPFALYGLPPFHTQDLINQQTISNNIFENIPTIIENDVSNKTQVRLKTVRERLDDAEVADGIANAIIIPVEGDIHEDADGNSASIELVEDQHFLIEYRNGEGFDNLSPLYHENESKGIMISHVIIGSELYSVIDIECAVALPEGTRNPDLAWGTSSSRYEYNGLWYCGKPENDWMDDLLPNNSYPDGGEKGAWWRYPTSLNMCGLPTDFFNDTDRNMFTPTTYPSTKSWKNNETNIGIYIDNIDGDYADVTVYRNYHSVPLTDNTAKEIIEGEKGLTIAGDGYIGEKFYVDENMYLNLGGGNINLYPLSRTMIKRGLF
ncbi:MAG: hypothetical protein PF574_04120 [Candidatus Delongbacteria bacterium]|jgi:hypothetical protein|nr:hypothetical protein [Candidatus Delongbacteria bacterium]